MNIVRRDIEYNEKIIILSDENLLELLNCFESHNENLIHEIAPLYNSPYSKEKLIEIVSQWYDQTIHKTKDNISAIVNK